MENNQDKARKTFPDGYRKNVISDEMREKVLKEFKYFKEEQRMSNKAIAEKMNFRDRRYVEAIFNGKDILVGNLEKVANALGCSLEIKFVKKGE